MNFQYVAIAVICIGLVLVAWMVISPRTFPIEDLTEKGVIVKAEVHSPIIGPPSVKITRTTVVDTIFSVGGFALFPIGGRVEFTVYHGDIVVDRKAKKFQLGWLDEWAEVEAELSLGSDGSGTYRIVAHATAPEIDEWDEVTVTI